MSPSGIVLQTLVGLSVLPHHRSVHFGVREVSRRWVWCPPENLWERLVQFVLGPKYVEIAGKIEVCVVHPHDVVAPSRGKIMGEVFYSLPPGVSVGVSFFEGCHMPERSIREQWIDALVEQGHVPVTHPSTEGKGLTPETVNFFAYSDAHHNGPKCAACGAIWCMPCSPPTSVASCGRCPSETKHQEGRSSAPVELVDLVMLGIQQWGACSCGGKNPDKKCPKCWGTAWLREHGIPYDD